MQVFALAFIPIVLPSLVLSAPTTRPIVLSNSEITSELQRLQSHLSSMNDELKRILKIAHEEDERSREQGTDKNFDERPKLLGKDEQTKGENDYFIEQVALSIVKRITPEKSPLFIKRLVNTTANHLIEKMNATHGIEQFHTKLLSVVLKLFNEKVMGPQKGKEGFNSSMAMNDKGLNGVDQRKVVQALEELLERPVLKGFVSEGKVKHMIRTAVTTLAKDFRMSGSTTEKVIEAMVSNIHTDVEHSQQLALNHERRKPMTDEEKIKGLRRMVEDKVVGDRLNLKEMKSLVKGLAVAVGARNNFSAENTKQLEEKIILGVEMYFARSKVPESESSPLRQPVKPNKDFSDAFRQALEEEAKENVSRKSTFDVGDRRSFEASKDKRNEDNSKSDLFEQLRELERKWRRVGTDEETLEGRKRTTEARKQKQYLKKILSNSIALIELLDADDDRHHAQPQRTTAVPTKRQTDTSTRPTINDHVTDVTAKTRGNDKTASEMRKPTKIATTNHTPTRKGLVDESTTVKTPTEGIEEVAKKNVIPHNMGDEIRKTAMEIQKEIERQQLEDELKTVEFKDKKKTELQGKGGEQKTISENEIENAEKEIENELEGAKANVGHPKLSFPSALKVEEQSTKNPEDDDSELIKELDDLFKQDKPV